MPASSELLKRAVQAAQSGQRDLSRQLFLQLVEENPLNRAAWAGLCEVVDDPEDKLTALENALALCKHGTAENIDLHNRRDALLKKHPHLLAGGLDPQQKERVEEMFRLALRLSGAGKLNEASALLKEIVEINPRDERAWLKYSEVCSNLEEKLRALNRVVALNPGNGEGWNRLEQLRQTQQDPLKRGQFLEEQGRFDQAVEIYRLVVVHSRSATERLEAEQRIANIHLTREAHRIQPVNPTMNLLRLAAGPVLLFIIMVFMQSGLNPLHTPLLAIPGVISVILGGILVTVVGMRPAHPKWIEIVGQPGTGDEPEIRTGLRVLGWALMLAPFTIFLIEASYRLGVLQASMLANLR
jgi:tetratricopeptide (TPR) repeat protein